ncbi:MAG TPA: aminotransferase DegT [Cytophagales bacterium]|jgi:dTDP-4-amino-4,6-dideoxygalactose transaminase|nr:aminotransferase DegT [Cytophagales bacterium]
MIPVTKPFLPPQEEYEAYLKGIWQRNWLTNNGPLVNELELQLKNYLGLKHLLYVSNGTIAIQLAIKALGLKGQIITTPFSYVATTSSIVWEGCEPVFVDIVPQTFNIDAGMIEAAITPATSAILATHCFGNACDIDAIDAIAKRHHLKVIYDAAHCFGTSYKGKSVFDFGDVSTTSFHATKLFHTVEGGAVFTKESSLLKKMAYMRNFGHDGPEKFNGVGINGKNSEFHAAMGLCNLKYIDDILARRREQSLIYDSLFYGLDIQRIKIQEHCTFNYAYYPVVFSTEELTLKVKNKLEAADIFPRRYFYPSLSRLNYISTSPTPVADDISSRILCLPVYFELMEEDQNRIAEIVKTVVHA